MQEHDFYELLQLLRSPQPPRGFDGPKTLNLCYQELTDVQIVSLAVTLRTNTWLTELDLSNNKIGNAGAVALADALRTNTWLTKLDLSNNKIGDAGAVALADALRTNTTLTSLELQRNHICVGGFTALKRMLQVNTSLTVMSTDGNYPIKPKAQPSEFDTDGWDYSYSIDKEELSAFIDTSAGEVDKFPMMEMLEKSLQVNWLFQHILTSGEEFVPQNFAQKCADLKRRYNEIKKHCLFLQNLGTGLQYSLYPVEVRSLLKQFTEKFPTSSSELPPCYPQKVHTLLQGIEHEITHVTHLIVGHRYDNLQTSELALKAVVDLLQFNLDPESPKLLKDLFDSCIFRMFAPDAGVRVLNYQILLKAASQATAEIQSQNPTNPLHSYISSLISRYQDYNPIAAGKLLAIPEVMTRLGLPPVIEANKHSLLFLDPLLRDLPSVNFQSERITTETVLAEPANPSSMAVSFFGGKKPPTGASAKPAAAP